MADHYSKRWALKLTATAGSDLNLVEKVKLETYTKRANLLKPGPVARLQHLEIMDRETGESGHYVFLGGGVGFGAGIISADVSDEWHPFNTEKAINLSEFSKHAVMVYNVSAGLGFNYAPISGIRFVGIDIHRDSNWEQFWHGNGIDVHGINAGTTADVSYVGGKVFMIDHHEGDPAVVSHLDEINQVCIAHGLDTPDGGAIASFPPPAAPEHASGSGNQTTQPAQAASGAAQYQSSTSGDVHTSSAHPQDLHPASYSGQAPVEATPLGFHASPDSAQGTDSSTPADANFTDSTGHAIHFSADSDFGHAVGASSPDFSLDASMVAGHALHFSPDSAHASHNATASDANFLDGGGQAIHVSPNSNQSAHGGTAHITHSSDSSTPSVHHVVPDSVHAPDYTPTDANLVDSSNQAVHFSPDSSQLGHNPAQGGHASDVVPGHDPHASPDSAAAHLNTPADANYSTPEGHATHVDIHTSDTGGGTH
jgi:hypothetical protein